MSQAHKPLHLRALRLVGFHNFHDVLIPIRGDLFAVGSNESGKTTILDALHLVLTGGQHVDLNAAASVVGPRSGGRTVQGIILRADMRGQPRKQGGITYAVAELAEPNTSRPPHTLVLGMSATDMQSRVRRWGLICRTPAADLPLTQPTDDGKQRIVDDQELEQALGQQLHRRMPPYRAAVAELLFDEPQAYELVLDLWRKAKSYREIARSARDPGAVIRQVLPSPDRRAFENVAKSLADIAEWEVHLNELRSDVEALTHLDELLQAAREARETFRRYQYVAASHELATVRRHVQSLQNKLDGERRRRDDFKAKLDGCEQEISGLKHRLNACRASEGMQLVNRIRYLEGEHKKATQRVQQRLKDIQELQTEIEKLEAEEATQRQAVEQQLTATATTLNAAQESLREVTPAVASTLDHLVGTLPRAPEASLNVDTITAALDRFTNSTSEASQRLDQRNRALTENIETWTTEHAEVKAALDRLTRHEDLVPELPGLDEALVALKQAGIAYQLLYQTLDYADGVNESEAGAIEATLGVARLSTIIVAPEHVTDAQRLVNEQCHGVRVMEAEPALAIAPPVSVLVQRMLDRLIVHDPRVAAHLRAVVWDTAVLTEPPQEGMPLQWWTTTGHGGEPGTRWLKPLPAPMWIGAERRRRERDTRMTALTAQLKELEQQISEAKAERAQITDAQARLQKAKHDIDQLGLPWQLNSLFETLASTQKQLDQLRPRAQRASGMHDEERQTCDGLEQELDAARQQAADENVDALVEQVRRLENDLASLQQQEKALIGRHATAKSEADGLAKALADAEEKVEPAGRELAEHAESLLAVLDGVDAMGLEHYVFTDKRASQIKPDNLPQLKDEVMRRESAALKALEGSDGVMREQLVRRYGFRVDDRDGRINILDPKGRTLASLVDERQQQLQQAQDTMGQKTQELFSRVLGSELLSQLRTDLTETRRRRRELNHVLEPLIFGHSRFQLHENVTSDARPFVDLIESAALTNPAARDELVSYIHERRAEFDAEGDVPGFLDYRNWFNFSFRLKQAADDTTTAVGSEDMVRGSGGAQGTHVYLLLFAMAALLFNRCGARLRLLMLDEAFYGVDSERQPMLLRCAKQLQLDVALATPELDGTVNEDSGDSTTVLVEKDAHDEVEVVPFVWEQQKPQQDLFEEDRQEPIIPGTNHEPT